MTTAGARLGPFSCSIQPVLCARLAGVKQTWMSQAGRGQSGIPRQGSLHPELFPGTLAALLWRVGMPLSMAFLVPKPLSHGLSAWPVAGWAFTAGPGQPCEFGGGGCVFLQLGEGLVS